MSDADTKAILARLDALTVEVRALRAERGPETPSGDLTVEQFAQAIGRKPLYVYRRIASRKIAVRSGGKPYQIPADQVAKFRKPTRTT
jgi:hypothetical protein